MRLPKSWPGVSKSGFFGQNTERIGYIRGILAECFLATPERVYLTTASRRSVQQGANILDVCVRATSEDVLREAITVATFIPGFIRKPLVVAQVSTSYGRWTSGVVREVCRRNIGDDGVIDHDAIAAIEMAHVQKLCSLLCECVLTLRFGTMAAHASDGEK